VILQSLRRRDMQIQQLLSLGIKDNHLKTVLYLHPPRLRVCLPPGEPIADP
jgi:hypothetical protein